MQTFGDKIKELREQNQLRQREVAAQLEIDTPMLSKIERGERKAKREQVVILAKLLDGKEDELLTYWLADKVYGILENEVVAAQVLEMIGNDFKNKRKK